MKNIMELYREIRDFKKGYQLRNNIVKGEKGDWVTDAHSILSRCRNHFSQLFNVRGVSNVMQAEIHAAGRLVPETSAFEVEMTIEKLKSHKSTGIDQIPAELTTAEGRTSRSGIHKLITFIWNKEELSEEWTESIMVPIGKKGDKTDCSNYRGLSHSPTTYKILSNILLSSLTQYEE